MTSSNIVRGARWDGKPKAGSRWHRRGTRGYGFVIEYPAETRHVIDRTLGGDVLYCAGRYSRSSWRHSRCTLNEWNAWVAGDAGQAPAAKEVK